MFLGNGWEQTVVRYARLRARRAGTEGVRFLSTSPCEVVSRWPMLITCSFSFPVPVCMPGPVCCSCGRWQHSWAV